MNPDDLRALAAFVELCKREGWAWLVTRATDDTYQVGVRFVDGTRPFGKPKPRLKEAIEALRTEMRELTKGIEWTEVAEIVGAKK